MADLSELAKRLADSRKEFDAIGQAGKQLEAIGQVGKQLEAMIPKIPSHLMPDYKVVPVRPPDGHLASGFYMRLKEWISEFEAALDDQTEVGAHLVSFGQALTFHLTEMTYWDPQLIRFDGFDSQGQPVQLIQHVSQISVLLTKVPKLGDTPRRIGFHADDSQPAADRA
jgi:hypothetical protein